MGKFTKLIDENGTARDTARVEIDIIGPVTWSPLLRFRWYMDNDQPENHMTVWYIYRLSGWFGTYTPPGWFLKLIGQNKTPV